MVRDVELEPTRPLQSSDFKSDMCYQISSLADYILVRAPGIEPGSLAPRRRFTNKLMDVSHFWSPILGLHQILSTRRYSTIKLYTYYIWRKI